MKSFFRCVALLLGCCSAAPALAQDLDDSKANIASPYREKLMAFDGTVAGDTMAGEVRTRDRPAPWTARRPLPR